MYVRHAVHLLYCSISHSRPPPHLVFFFFFNDRATTEISPLSLPAALPIWMAQPVEIVEQEDPAAAVKFVRTRLTDPDSHGRRTSEPIPRTEYEGECAMVL